MITSICIAPSVGWADDEGRWQPGAVNGSMVEAELVRSLTTELGDELDRARLRWRALPTALHPGLTPVERMERIEPGMVVLNLAFPASIRGVARAAGLVRYPALASYPLAELMTEALGLWGKPFWQRYTASVRRDPLVSHAETLEVVVEPFALEHDGAATLAQRLVPLAASLAWGLGEFLRTREHGVSIGGIYRGRCY